LRAARFRNPQSVFRNPLRAKPASSAMSCTLLLLRHGIAADAAPGLSDSDRALTAEGARRMKRIAVGLKRLGVSPDVVLSSPLRRAQETAALLVAVVNPSLPVEVYDRLAPGHAASEVVGALRPYRAARQIVLVGHQPDLGELASYLLTGAPGRVPFAFKKGGVAAIDVSTVPPRSAGLLRWFAPPKMLRAVAG
jgi:phosphohistidine phosphatase